MTVYPQERVMPYGRQEEGKREQVEQMFDHIAPRYDLLNLTLSLGRDRAWRRRALQALLPYRPERILDVATGTGDFAIATCRRLRPLSLVGTDISEGMLRVAREKVAQAGLQEHISLAHEDCSALSFADETFDAVTVAFGVRNFDHLDHCLAELCRVLRPGGCLVILELSKPVRSPVKQLFTLYARMLIPLLGWCISRDWHAYSYLQHSIRAFPQAETVQDIIRQAGFSKVSFRRMTAGICTLFVAEK